MTFFNSICYLWRLIAKGISFACFGLGGFLIGSFLFQLYYFNWFKEENLYKVSRKVIAKSFGSFIYLMKYLGLITFEVQGLEKLQSKKPLVIIANHLTLIDVVFLGFFAKNANCIVKGALLRNPFTRPPIKACGFLNNDSKTLISDAVACLNKGQKLIVFPEGTRTLPDKEIRFQRGAFHIALQAKSDILPVFITCNPLTLGKANKWYQLGVTRSHFVFTVGDVLSINAWLSTNTPLAKRVRDLTRFTQSMYLDTNEL